MDSVSNSRMQQDTAVLERELAELKAQNAEATVSAIASAAAVAKRDERIRELRAKLQKLTTPKLGALRSDGPAIQHRDSKTWTAGIDVFRNYDRGAGPEWHLNAIEFHHKDRHAAEALRNAFLAGDSVAAQTTTTALRELWKLLGVDDQTGAVVKLRKLITREVSEKPSVRVDNTSAHAAGAAVGAAVGVGPRHASLVKFSEEIARDFADLKVKTLNALECAEHRADTLEKALKLSHEQNERLYALLDERNKAADAAEQTDPKSLRYRAWLGWIGCRDHPFARARFAELEKHRPWLVKGWDRVVAAVRR